MGLSNNAFVGLMIPLFSRHNGRNVSLGILGCFFFLVAFKTREEESEG